MIREYANGREFIEDNEAFLNQNRYMSAFFYLDAKLLEQPNKADYAMKVTDDSCNLVALKVDKYNLMLYGDRECVGELMHHLEENGYEYDGVLCPTDIGEELIKVSKELSDRECELMIGMDFMETRDYTGPSSSEVVRPVEEDLDEMLEMINRFFMDCGLPDKMEKEKLQNRLNDFRIIRDDGMIVSLAAYQPNTDTSCKIAYVYTRPQYRGRGYGRKVVNTIKNEILAQGMTATLNVDQANPISNHLYESLGFRKVFSQGVYTQKKSAH
ncbi:MAG: GNAT family N-acetyltransferase [Erysipelotrichaceae bacterium]|nr:GNAT family N-acetyltransferase [Erysipelotrichaceae bacterium]